MCFPFGTLPEANVPSTTAWQRKLLSSTTLRVVDSLPFIASGEAVARDVDSVTVVLTRPTRASFSSCAREPSALFCGELLVFAEIDRQGHRGRWARKGVGMGTNGGSKDM